jgi:hypothetical protein
MTDPTEERFATAIRWRGRAIKLINRGRPILALLALRRSLKAINSAPEPTDIIGRLNCDHLVEALYLEITLLEGVQQARLADAARAFELLVDLHQTSDRATEAIQELPGNLRVHGISQFSKTPRALVFALPIRTIRKLVLAVTPHLADCVHGHLNAAGACARHCPQR